MRREQPTPPQVALVVKWPSTSSIEPLAQQLIGKLAERRLTATWAMAEPRQVEAVARWSGATVRFEGASLAPAGGVVDSLKQFAAAGESIATVCMGTEQLRAQDFRTLCQLGVRSIVAVDGAGKAGAVQSLPFGLLQFTPVLCAPTAGWIQRWFGKTALNLPEDVESGKAVIVVDLARMATTGGRGWRELDRLLHQLDEARLAGHLAPATMAAVTGEIGRASATRPQRSILRAA